MLLQDLECRLVYERFILVVCNDYLPERTYTDIGYVEIKVPKVRDRSGEYASRSHCYHLI
ncbi:MAG: hypothetical protein ACTS73_07290 [Arsenophonus sp. NEOnobi-MAG3]